MYAIIQNGTHQYKAQAGTFLRVEKRNEKPGDKGSFDKILAFSNKEGLLTLGEPYVTGAKVYFQVIRHGKGKKKLVFKKNRRKGYRRTKGHRQEFTELYIETLLDSSGQQTSLPLKKKPKQESSSPALKVTQKPDISATTQAPTPSDIPKKTPTVDSQKQTKNKKKGE